jgi:small subunit ribosomal protein S6
MENAPWQVAPSRRGRNDTLNKQYEAMFLFDPGFAAEFQNAQDEIQRLMGRIEAEILLCRKWDERRLAYELKGRKRGVYVLVYFRADPARIRDLERDVQLSEPVLRLLVLTADDVTPERMEHFAPDEKVRPEPTESEPAEASSAKNVDKQREPAPPTEAVAAADADDTAGAEPQTTSSPEAAD